VYFKEPPFVFKPLEEVQDEEKSESNKKSRVTKNHTTCKTQKNGKAGKT
jgi:hypothetical protein